MSVYGNRSAFPVGATAVEQGVSQRDWFAAMALQGLVAKGMEVIGDRVVTESERNLLLARRAYGLADAMLTVGSEPTSSASAR
jgi:hypothetical protein